MNQPKNDLYQRQGNEINSKKGFKIRFGKERISYIEDDEHALALDAYFLTSPKLLEIYLKNAYWKWYPPFVNEEIDEKRKKEIISRIDEALAYVGIQHRFIK